MTTPVEIIPANDVALLQEKLTKALAGEITLRLLALVSGY